MWLYNINKKNIDTINIDRLLKKYRQDIDKKFLSISLSILLSIFLSISRITYLCDLKAKYRQDFQ